MGRVVHAWVAVEDEVLILCYQMHTTHDNEQMAFTAFGYYTPSSAFINNWEKYLLCEFAPPIYLCILFQHFNTSKPGPFFPDFSNTSLCCYLQALSPCFFYTAHLHRQYLSMTKTKNNVKQKRTSSTSVLVMGVELQVSGYRTFASGAMIAIFITSYWILQVFWRKNPKPHKYQSSLRLERTEFLWERGDRQRGRGVIGS